MQSMRQNGRGLILHTATYPDRAFAIGRIHESWFVLSVDFPHLPASPIQCINFIAEHISLVSPRKIFLFNGAPRGLSHFDLLRLRDDRDGPALKLTGDDIGSRPLLEVLLDTDSILHCCSACGKWQSLHGDRFLECGGLSRCILLLGKGRQLIMMSCKRLMCSPGASASKQTQMKTATKQTVHCFNKAERSKSSIGAAATTIRGT